MSYEPTLLIKVESMRKHKKLFQQGYYTDEETRGGESNKTLLEYLGDVWHEDKEWIIDVFGIKCKTCTPTFSTYNSQIRNKLDELKIEYCCVGG